MNQETINELKINEGQKRADLYPPKFSQAATGGFFILMGSIFLLGMLDVTIFGRSAWWLVALLPTYWIGFAAYRAYQQEGQLSGRVLAIALFGLLPFAYLFAGVLGFNVGAIWPLGIIVMGISFLVFGRK